MKPGDVVPFFAPWTTATPKAATIARIERVNDDGTADVVGLVPGLGGLLETPIAGVPVHETEEEHQANGPFVLNRVIDPAAPASTPTPTAGGGGPLAVQPDPSVVNDDPVAGATP